MNAAGSGEAANWGPSTKGTLGSILAARAAERPDKVCLTFEDGPVTYRQLEESTTAVANNLFRLGARPGDRVAVLMPNGRAVVEAWFGVAKLGGIYVGINTAYVGDYLRHQLATAGCKVVITNTELGERVSAVAGGVPSLEHLVVADGDGSVASPRPGLSVLTMAELRAGSGDRLEVERPARWDEPCAIQYTAGTTGPSKGALITQNYLVRSSELLRGQMGMDEHHVAYTPLPLFHLNAMICTILPAILSGASAVIDTWFSVSRYWEQVRRQGATHISLLGPMMVMLWNQPRRDDDAANSVQVMLCAPVPTDIHRPFEERFGLDIVTAYGLSEAVPILLSLPTPPGFAGRPSPVFDVRLFDDEEQEVPVGEVGEIVCRPREPHVMFEGYFGNPEATVGLLRNLWFHTGDLGRANEDGYVQFVDRKKDYLRRRGENVSSFEAEQAIRAHALVADVAVLGVPSEIGEDDVMACVVVQPGESLTFEELLAHCIDNMPYFAVPRYIEFLDELPRNPVGRVLKHELRRRGVTAATFDRGPGRPQRPVQKSEGESMTTVEFGTVAVYEAMADLLNNDPAWAEKGKSIDYSMVFEYGPPVAKTFFLRFGDGKVFDVKELGSVDAEKADFILSAAPEVWRGIFDQTINPTNALVKGQIKVKGKIAALLRHMTAFSYIIEAMTKIELH